jgi:hypothetical protein
VRAAAPRPSRTTAAAAVPARVRVVSSLRHNLHCSANTRRAPFGEGSATAPPRSSNRVASRLIRHRGPNVIGTPKTAGSSTECNPARW